MPLRDFLAALIPTMDADPAVQYRWRWMVAIVTGATLAGLVMFVMLAFAIAPADRVFAGFARRDDVVAQVAAAKQDAINEHAEMQAIWKDIRTSAVNQLTQSILVAIQARCKTKSEEARILYTRQIMALEQQYTDFTNGQQRYDEPACTAF